MTPELINQFSRIKEDLSNRKTNNVWHKFEIEGFTCELSRNENLIHIRGRKSQENVIKTIVEVNWDHFYEMSAEDFYEQIIQGVLQGLY